MSDSFDMEVLFLVYDITRSDYSAEFVCVDCDSDVECELCPLVRERSKNR